MKLFVALLIAWPLLAQYTPPPGGGYSQPIRAPGFTFDGGGVALTAGKTGYFTYVGAACTISAYAGLADTGTWTIDIWKIATGSAIPTVANTITASALPTLASGTSTGKVTALTGWTTSVAAYDIFAFKLTAVSGATYINIELECDQVK